MSLSRAGLIHSSSKIFVDLACDLFLSDEKISYLRLKVGKTTLCQKFDFDSFSYQNLLIYQRAKSTEMLKLRTFLVLLDQPKKFYLKLRKWRYLYSLPNAYLTYILKALIDALSTKCAKKEGKKFSFPLLLVLLQTKLKMPMHRDDTQFFSNA